MVQFEQKKRIISERILFMNLCDIKTVRDIMKAFHLEFKKEFGQNFLTDKTVVEEIADACCCRQSNTILEIGPGIGTLTRELCERYTNVVAYEIDRNLVPVLKYTLGEYDNVKIINEDIMKADLADTLSEFMSGGVSVCANLPYYITTPILMMLLESRIPFDFITIMIQSEVADRLCAKPGKSQYGAITAALNYYGTAEKLLCVPASSFIPAPKVNSTVVRIQLYKESPYRPYDEALMFRVIRAAFEQRRKTLVNALSNGLSDFDKETILDAILSLGLREDIRGEKLSIEEFIDLANALKKHERP